MVDTPEEHTPEFTLPEWGTSGAPELPIESPAGEPIERPEEDHQPIPAVLSTGSAATTSSGLVVASASVEGADPQHTSETAAGIALDRLARAATARGASAVVDVRLEVSIKAGHATVVAYGTTVGA